ncbi:LysR family transcriptional regulator ArgP [Frigidibacter sp. MR17.24]|uniref:LysR family transcriptional regulator ArgP n=1 Tax=Frigidibacter sp. MR17.24 TaxID=3127345 RepID=UPI003012DD13
MLDSAQLETLSAVLRLGSFEAAAGRLGVTPSAVSQRIRALEERVGTVLIERGPPVAATPEGARLAAHAETVRLLEAEVLGPAAPRGDWPVIRIAVNADSLATWFLPALAATGERLFDLVIDDQDHSADWLRRGEVLAAVSGHARAVQGCDTRALGRLRYVATASPGFAARWFAGGVTAEALARAPTLVFDRKDRMQADWARAATGQAIALPAHRIASSEAFVSATELGLGWALNPECLVRAALAEGRLVALRPELSFDTALHWQWSRRAAGPLAPLTRAVRAAAARVLLAD